MLRPILSAQRGPLFVRRDRSTRQPRPCQKDESQTTTTAAPGNVMFGVPGARLQFFRYLSPTSQRAFLSVNSIELSFPLILDTV